MAYVRGSCGGAVLGEGCEGSIWMSVHLIQRGAPRAKGLVWRTIYVLMTVSSAEGRV